MILGFGSSRKAGRLTKTYLTAGKTAFKSCGGMVDATIIKCLHQRYEMYVTGSNPVRTIF